VAEWLQPKASPSKFSRDNSLDYVDPLGVAKQSINKSIAAPLPIAQGELVVIG
jgi:hypothetical protein